MLYYNISDRNHKATFGEAIVNGLAPGGGLYFPESIPQFGSDFFAQLSKLSLQEIAHTVLNPYVESDIDAASLEKIVGEVFNFEIPLVEVEPGIFSLELFHGPTLAFKDVGARFLAKSMQYLNKDRIIRVLVATSGDTGSAVANGFLGIPGTEVVVLYPKGKVSELQQKQFATLGQNIIPIAIEGTFDDCQLLVKSAFGDAEINKPMNLTSANSINVARWIPQSVYYYWAVAQLQAKTSKKTAICVPSGNLGNLTSGILAMKTGLPVNHFVASSNQNDIVPKYLLSGLYEPKPSVQTLANAMDVGNPNNFPRLIELYGNDFSKIKQELSGTAYNDSDIENLVRSCYKSNNYLCDPHGATGYGAIKKFCSQNTGHVGVFLETAHPCKFIEDVERIIGKKIELPQKLKEFASRTIQSHTLKADYALFKTFLKDTAR